MGGYTQDASKISLSEKEAHLNKFMEWFAAAGVVGPIAVASLNDANLRAENTNAKVLGRVLAFVKKEYAEQFALIDSNYRENFLFIDSKDLMGNFFKAMGYEDGAAPSYVAKPINFLICTALVWDSWDEESREAIYPIFNGILNDLMAQKMAIRLYKDMDAKGLLREEEAVKEAPTPGTGFMSSVMAEA